MVYKGCEKRMIMIKNTGSEIFEEAYFILNNKKGASLGHSDMIKEANRIVADNSISAVRAKSCGGRTGVICYISGFLSGIGALGLLLAFFL